MGALRARVENGRLRLDEPTTLPEGTTVDLVIVDAGDDLSDEERRELHSFLEESWQSAQEGESMLASDFVKELRDRR